MYVWMAWRLREARNTWGRKAEVVVARDERREAESGKTGQWMNREEQRAVPPPARAALVARDGRRENTLTAHLVTKRHGNVGRFAHGDGNKSWRGVVLLRGGDLLDGNLGCHPADVELGKGLPLGRRIDCDRCRNLHPLAARARQPAVPQPVAANDRHVLARVLSLLLRRQLIVFRIEEHDASRVGADGQQPRLRRRERDESEVFAHLPVAQHQCPRHLRLLPLRLHLAEPEPDTRPVNAEGGAGAVEGEPLGWFCSELLCPLRLGRLLKLWGQLKRHLA